MSKWMPKPKHRRVPESPAVVVMREANGYWQWETVVFGNAFRFLAEGIADSQDAAIEAARRAQEISEIKDLDAVRSRPWVEVPLP